MARVYDRDVTQPAIVMWYMCRTWCRMFQSKNMKGIVHKSITSRAIVVCVCAYVYVFAGRFVEGVWRTGYRYSQRYEWQSVDTTKGGNVYEVARWRVVIS